MTLLAEIAIVVATVAATAVAAGCLLYLLALTLLEQYVLRTRGSRRVPAQASQDPAPRTNLSPPQSRLRQSHA